jgi:DNA-binding response OmpR family regulator
MTRGSFELISAGTAAEGIRLAEAVQPDAIVLDVHLPDQDGWSVLSRFKTHAQTSAIPIVILTAMDAHPGALGDGAVGIVAKPVDSACLRRLEGLLRRDEAAEERVFRDDEADALREEACLTAS